MQDATAPDPFLSAPDFRLTTMLGHLIPERLFLSDLRVGAEIATAAPNRTLTVLKVDEDGATLSDGRQQARIVGKEEPLYDLGNVFFVDRVLFTETSDVVAAMEKSKESSDADVVLKSVGGDAEDFGLPSSSDEQEDTEDDELGEAMTKEEQVVEGLREDASLLLRIPDGEEDKENTFKVVEDSPDKVSAAAAGSVETAGHAEESKSAGAGGGGASIGFPQDLDWDSEEVEEKVIFVNNQKISILTQKRTEAGQKQEEEAKVAR